MACRYIRSRYGTPCRDAQFYSQQAAQEQLDEYYTPGRVSRASSTFDVNRVLRGEDAASEEIFSPAMSRSSSRAGSLSPYDYGVCSTSNLGVTSPYALGSNFPSRSVSRSRASTPQWTPDAEEEARMRRSSSRSQTPVPSYTDALCAVSKRLRQRSIPPPPPPVTHKPAVPRASVSSGKPPPAPRVIASDYYKKYIKSIYEREPLFRDFYNNIPPGERNFYNRESIAKLKRDFQDTISDKWSRKGCKDPTVEHDLAKKLYPWGNVVDRDPEPASERLFRIHTSRPRDPSPSLTPKIRVYHRSTWAPSYPRN